MKGHFSTAASVAGLVLGLLSVLSPDPAAAAKKQPASGASAAAPAAPPGQRDKGFAESRSTAEALDASFAPRKVAVVVGIKDYEDPAFPALRWAREDATEIGRILQDPQYGGFDRVVVLTEPAQARRDRILAEMVSLRNDLRRQDSLVVYVSSHGTLSLDDGSEPRLWLVAADTRPGDLRGSAIELAELQRFFSEIRAERKALILDACYNGQAKSTLQPSVRQRVERLEDSPALSRKVRLGESEAHLFASTFGRPAREDDSLGHGIYTYHLLDALTWSQGEADANGDGVVTVYEAHDHARKETIAWTTGEQVPEAYFRLVGRNDLVLVGRPDARVKAEMAVLFHYGPEDDPYSGASLSIDGREKGVFPGTFEIPPGRHRVQVIGSDGSLLQDRLVSTSREDPLDVEALHERPSWRNGFLGVGPKLRLAPSARIQPLVGRAAVGAEILGGYRFLGVLRGLTLSGGIGYAPQQAKFVDGGAVRYEPRHLLWGNAGVGLRGLFPRAMLGGGYRLRLQGVSAIHGPGCDGVAACQGWVFFVHGLYGEQGISLGRRWTLLLDEELGVSALDPLGEGVGPAVDLGMRIGVEVSL
jgi:uncharacterized caspase-like protein